MIRTRRAWSQLGRRMPLTHRCQPAKTANGSNFRYAATPSSILRTYTAAKPVAHDTQHPTAQAAPATPKSIPGPSWLWLEPIYEPFRRYGRVQRRRPYMTQFVSALVIYFFGDMVAQSLGPTQTSLVEDVKEERGWVQEWAEDRDWARTGRALVIGGAAAVPGYKWFLWLSNSFNYSSKVLSLTTKVTVNQILFTPVFNSYFFGMQSLLTGASFPEIWERIQNTVPTSWINSCKVWPAITAFSFTFIPLEYRSIFGGVIAIGWQTYLSLLNQRAAEQEGALDHQHELGHEPDNTERTSLKAPREEQKCAA